MMPRLCALWALLSVAGASASFAMKDVRLLYNNDGENLMTVTSPYHPAGAPLSASVIEGSVSEAITDVNLICPFHGIPWWRSALEPPEAHAAWYDRTFNFTHAAGGGWQLDYVLNGGDFVGTFANASRAIGQTPFVSFRLNDGQCCAHRPTPNNDPSGVADDHQFDRLSRFWYDRRFDASAVLGLEESPPKKFRPCCWQDDPKTKKPACSCPSIARRDSAEDLSRLDALLFTASDWIFIPAHCFAVP